MARKWRCCPRSAVARLVLTGPLDVRLLTGGLSVGEALAAFNAAHPQAGGVASFLGKVRPGAGESPVKALELTHYEPLTLSGMEQLAGQAFARFALDGVLVWHRIGVLTPGEGIVLVAAAARHRRGALEAVDFLMDHLKSAAWLWKRERRGSGWHWIEPRTEDHAALARWQ
jgi:molybdopterin synthase catalytic subunit